MEKVEYFFMSEIYSQVSEIFFTGYSEKKFTAPGPASHPPIPASLVSVPAIPPPNNHPNSPVTWRSGGSRKSGG
jgi:hypothetical protein